MIDIVQKAKASIEKVQALGDKSAAIFTEFDAERILSEANRLQERGRNGGGDMPLFGLLVSVKDLFDEKGQRTSAGSRLLKERAAATRDAVVIERLKSAGALMFGRTTMSEFAYSGVGLNPHFGTPGNVFDETRIPGGSTSGGALSVAYGICEAALGTDTGGSVRIPAAVNGLYGYKPTQSSVPRDGVHPLSATYDSIGPLARDLDTAIRIFEVLSNGITPITPPDRPLRLAVPINAFTNGIDRSTSDAFIRATNCLGKAGHQLIEVDFGFLDAAAHVNRIIVSVEAHAIYRDDLERLEKIGDPRVLQRIRFAESLTSAEIERAYAERSEALEHFSLVVSNFDSLIAPTLAIAPPTIAETETEFDRVNAMMLRNCSLINLADGCAVSMPMAGGGGAPGALMIAGPSRADAEVLGVSRLVRTLLPLE